MPSDKYKNLTLGASNSTYTAPANGFVYFAKASTASGQWFNLYSQNNMSVSYNAQSSGQTMKAYLPIKKGDTFTLAYNLGGTTESFMFIYAQGDV